MPDQPNPSAQPEQPDADGPDAEAGAGTDEGTGEGQDAELSSPVWNRPAPQIPDVLKDAPPPRHQRSVILPRTKRRRRLSFMPQSSSSEMRAIGLGLDFVSMVGAAILFGWGSDRLLGTTHGTIFGLAIGLVLASWHLFKGARKLNHEFDQEASAKNPSGPPPTTIQTSITPNEPPPSDPPTP